MLERFEEINLDVILNRAGLFRNEFDPDEYDAWLYDYEVKDILFSLFSYDKEIVNYLRELNTIDLNNDYLTIHRKFVETLLNIKNKVKEEDYNKRINNHKIDYGVEKLLRQSDFTYVLNKYLKNEYVSEELMELAVSDYYMMFLVKLILDNYDEAIPNEFKMCITNRLEELDKFIPKN